MARMPLERAQNIFEYQNSGHGVKRIFKGILARFRAYFEPYAKNIALHTIMQLFTPTRRTKLRHFVAPANNIKSFIIIYKQYTTC